jgi:Icc protein
MNSRRQFLSTVGCSALALSVQHVAIGQGNQSVAKLALLSDSHIHSDAKNEYRGFRPYENLVEVVKQVVGSDSEFALLCGDAARQDGKADDYVQLKKLLEPIQSKMKMEIALGNHDDRANFWKVFGKPDSNAILAGKKHVTIADLGPQRWFVLDSLMFVDKVPGFLGSDQRDWLDQQLAMDSKLPVFLMVHHTLGGGDGDLLDTERLLAIAKKHPQVKGIVFGHSHRWKIVLDQGIWMINLPAIGYNFGDDQPVGWVQAELRANELKLTLSAVGGNRTDHQKSQTLSWAS